MTTRLLLLACLSLAACIAVDENGRPLRDDPRRSDNPTWRIDQASVAAGQAFSDGAIAEIEGSWQRARDAYTSIEEQDVEDLRAVLALARTHHAEGDPEAALELLEVELARRPASYELLLAGADTALATRDLPLALDYYRQAASLQPADAPPQFGMVAALILSEQYHAALEHLIRTPPRRLPRHLLVLAGRAALLADQPRYAASAFRLHLTAHDEDTQVWLEKARAHLLLDELDLAEEALTRALVLDPVSPDGFVLLGHVRYLTRDFTKALRCYQTAVKNGTDREVLAPVMIRLIAPGLQP